MLKDKENSTQAYVKFDDLSVGYGGKAIINDICIDIKKGEIVALIGPNGAGKSTILKTLTKQLAIIKGDVITKVDGQSVKELSELQEKLSHYKGGDKVKITIMRAGVDGYSEIEMEVTLGTKESFEG